MNMFMLTKVLIVCLHTLNVKKWLHTIYKNKWFEHNSTSIGFLIDSELTKKRLITRKFSNVINTHEVTGTLFKYYILFKPI